jgi:protein ImuA
MPPTPSPTDPASRQILRHQEAHKDKIAALRRRVGALPANIADISGADADQSIGPGWGVGVAEIDALLPGFERQHRTGSSRRAAGLHEIKPANVRDQAVAAAFALSILGRRAAVANRPVLWVHPRRTAGETGLAYAPGLSALGLAPERCLMVETRTRQETLWVLEEALKSQAVAAVLGTLDTLEMTPARRLVLAAAVPCLMLTGAASPGAVVAHTRWRLARCPTQNAHERAVEPDAAADTKDEFGRWRCRLQLERCRQGITTPQEQGDESRNGGWTMEWCDASFRFHLVTRLAAGADAPAAAPPRSGAWPKREPAGWSRDRPTRQQA